MGFHVKTSEILIERATGFDIAACGGEELGKALRRLPFERREAAFAAQQRLQIG